MRVNITFSGNGTEIGASENTIIQSEFDQWNLLFENE